MKKILIIEDDAVVANVYRNKFVVEGFTAEVASDGQAGIDMLGSFKPDLVLLDLMLPNVPGLEVLEHIRIRHENPQLPVVVFSNTYLTSMVEAAWKAGASKCMTKTSCTPREIIEVIRGILQTKALPGQTGGAPSSQAAPSLRQTQQAAPVSKTIRPAAEGLLTDLQSQEELRRKFSETLPAIVSGLTSQLLSVLKASSPQTKADLLGRMHKDMHTVTGCAGITGIVQVAQLSQATEALLQELRDKPEHINSSTLRTLANSLDFISGLLKPALLEGKDLPIPGNVLVVDDEPTSRRAVCTSLRKANLNRISVSNAQTALELLEENTFDLVILDINMPGINGIELCAKVRAMPRHANIPVLFVTGLDDFETRANSMMSGGTDIIGKPFLFLELAVKALVYALRPKTHPTATPPRTGTPIALQN